MQAKKNLKPHFYVTLSCFLLGWLLFFTMTYPSIAKQIKTEDWLSTEGEILKNETGKISYKYEIDNREFTSDRILFLQQNINAPKRWSQVVSDLPKEGAVTVYYDSATPSNSVLIKGFHVASVPISAIIPFLLIVTFPVIWAVHSFEKWKKPRKNRSSYRVPFR